MVNQTFSAAVTLSRVLALAKHAALEYTGGVPYELLRPVLERANPHQLYSLENHNPYLLEDTDELWKVLCQKEFRKGVREEMETWRDLYLVSDRIGILNALF